MNSEITVNDFSKHLFWDVDLNGFDLEKHKEQMIQKVLEYGQIEDWNLLKKYYGLQTIKEVALNLKSLDPVTLSFVSTIFKIDKKEFKCFEQRQLVQNVWNS
ncbi:DUF6922 domain-containing protein [Chryseobacterium koreense]|uniref:DUF6922 domain-containing protein n=1 Tax=Chryseobacterium koreense CCUG 49689 TaxID=1304281 RepID=A0A0J7LU13_9FLAO|nr:hypothetical protein [Chryseobacterium koreense]KMQ72430.1 hypothetical protein ACM44_01430 [Chryseobacterium koreense CCUG 49689]MBB5333480.1 ribosomal protein S8 [Chryseobacterium koreense]